MNLRKLVRTIPLGLNTCEEPELKDKLRSHISQMSKKQAKYELTLEIEITIVHKGEY